MGVSPCLLVYGCLGHWQHLGGLERSFSMKDLLSIYFCKSVTLWGQRILAVDAWNWRGGRDATSLPVFFCLFVFFTDEIPILG